MRVTVIGDVIIDRYTHTKKLGVSAETPTLVGEFLREETFVGGAGLVARHLLRRGVQVQLVTLGGLNSVQLRNLFLGNLSEDEQDRLTVVSDVLKNWRTVEKHRIFIDDYKVAQVDILNRGEQTIVSAEDLRTYIALSAPDKIIISDNGHGVVCPAVMRETIGLGIPTFVDCQLSQDRDFVGMVRCAKGCDTIFMNKREFDEACDTILGFGEKQSRLTDVLEANIVVKLGEKGADIYEKGKSPVRFPAQPEIIVPVDTCGAGDAFLAAYVSSGGDMTVANRWAARSTMYRGTVVPPFEEVRK